jgi:hypothetical protein
MQIWEVTFESGEVKQFSEYDFMQDVIRFRKYKMKDNIIKTEVKNITA